MKFIDFFAGIGGFRKGLEDAGHKCVGFCEIDKFAIASYTAMHLATKEQLNYVNSLPKSKRVKEIVKDVYKNGEWSATDIRAVSASDIPSADCWCFGAPCQDFSTAGKRAGLRGDKSSLVREIFRLLEERKEEDRPEWIIYENVKGMLSSERGLDFLSILVEMDELGYDIEWQALNSKDFGVPQDRKRVYTIGHLRARGSRKIFPISKAAGENSVKPQEEIKLKKIIGNSQGNKIYDSNGLSCTLKAESGNFGGKTGLYVVPWVCDMSYGRGLSLSKNVFALQSRYNKGACNRRNETSGVLVANDEMGYRIRRLIPKECFRLQGWTDDCFEKAALVNSDNQLYKQAGNGVTVNVVREIGKRLSSGEDT